MSNDTRDNRLRRMAKRQGLTIHKSRTRDPRALTFARYWLINRNGIIQVGGDHGLNVDEVEKVLTEDETWRRYEAYEAALR